MLPATTDDARFSCLSPRSLFRFGAVNQEEHLAVQSYQRRAFSVEDLLLRYFNDAQCIEFRTLQATTGTLISGSTAVEFFDRTRYAEHDLDLFVEHHHAIDVDWL
ncbi:hypothetical protein Hypma_016016 [Hypsizygus marmoreus]|uniref:Uncharacterized protein n=1 Tax=Hypsizygus marmoreus TaxID=39966 RepID=A0A369K7P6_HYPMA|nr:hypothetical protein Hypma_016016 [Hypsizygus marmoreus]